MVFPMSRHVSGREHDLPQQCFFRDCDQLTQIILVCGCLEQHVEDQYYCQQHADSIINSISYGRVCCHQGHEIISYQIRDIHWEASAFPNQWVLTGPAYRVLSASCEPEKLVKLMKTLPYTTAIYRIDADGPKEVYWR